METIRERRRRLTDELDLFLRRATDEGLLRSDLPPGWVGKLLPPLMRNAADELPELSAAQAADVVVETLLRGVGASQPGPERRAGLDGLISVHAAWPTDPSGQGAYLRRSDPAVRGERGRIWLPGDDDLAVSVVDRCVHDHLLEYHCKL